MPCLVIKVDNGNESSLEKIFTTEIFEFFMAFSLDAVSQIALNELFVHPI